jgi:hypothetical protein
VGGSDDPRPAVLPLKGGQLMEGSGLNSADRFKKGTRVTVPWNYTTGQQCILLTSAVSTPEAWLEEHVYCLSDHSTAPPMIPLG